MVEMKTIELQYTLPANIETSWKWLTEESLQLKWMEGLISLKREDGKTDYEAGSRWVMVMQEGKKQNTYYGMLPEVDYPKRFTLAVEAENLAPGGKIMVEYRLTPEGDKTHLDYSSKLVADRFPFLLKLMSPFIIMMIKRQNRKMFKSMISQMASG